MLTHNSVGVTWDRSPNATGYLISCTSPASYAGGKSMTVDGGDNTNHTVSDLIENTPYNITVQGLTRDGRKSEHSTKESIITKVIGK